MTKSNQNNYWNRHSIWDFIDRQENGCWIWKGRLDAGGYGGVSIHRKFMKAHRFMWELFNKKRIPKHMNILHKCDTPACCRPKHLFIGTQADNVADMVWKRRNTEGQRGSKNKTAKLNEDQAYAIRYDPRPNKVIAAEYKVSIGTVYFIKIRRSWKHVK